MSYGDHFSIHNIPYGIASDASHQPAAATRLGDYVIFLADLDLSVSPELKQDLSEPTLNALAARTKAELKSLRASIQTILSDSANLSKYGVPVDQVQLHLPIKVSHLTDFSCSKEHLINAGGAALGDPSLPPAFLHYPIGYGGRASSVVVSGTPVVRPHGQFKDKTKVVFGPTQSLDYELEMAAVIGRPSKLGEPVFVNDADEHIFGVVLLNDWSSRDIQVLEMRPLGPLNGKSFASSISPWIITLEALEPFAVEPPPKDLEPAVYLQDKKAKSTYDVGLTVEVIKDGTATTTCVSNQKWMYWTLRDLVAQLTINGCSLSTGDLLGTGTVSGTGPTAHGCLLESNKGGRVAWKLDDGQDRVWLEDGDEVRIVGYAGQGVGFGDLVGTVSPAKAL
ncbi:fumarylacetoacetase [Thozetella sp. PMI_491]|nr:fumarylacetoacetase [Thozetella sp. PMI_491]